MRQASLAGGLGACYAPNGEREGQSPLAFAKQLPPITCRGFGGVLRPQWGARGAKPTRSLSKRKASVARSARGAARSQARSADAASGSREREGRSPLAYQTKVMVS